MKVSFEGAGEKRLSFKNNNAADGNFVKVSANGTVSACSDGDRFVGCAMHCAGGFADVQVKGYIECAYTGTAPALGFAKMLAGAAGKVKADSNGAEFLVLKVDTTAGTVGFIM